MPSANEFWEVASQVASQRGGLVVAFVGDGPLPELGTSLDSVLGFAAPATIMISSVSDWEDWKEQVATFYRLRPSWGRGKPGDPDAKYYRVRLPAAELLQQSQAEPFSTAITLPSLSTYASPAGTIRGVTFWPRLAARILDFVVHYAVTFASGVLFVLLLVAASGGPLPQWVLRRLSQTHWPVFVAGILGSFSYYVACEAIHGSTLGKLIFSMQVLQEDGSRCRPLSAVIRELAYFVDALFFGLIAYSAMKDSYEQQRHGDQWAHTVVCKRRDVPADSQPGAMRFVLALMIGIFADMACMLLGFLLQINS